MHTLRVIEAGEHRHSLACTCGKWSSESLPDTEDTVASVLYELAGPHIRKHVGYVKCPQCKARPKNGRVCNECRRANAEFREAVNAC